MALETFWNTLGNCLGHIAEPSELALELLGQLAPRQRADRLRLLLRVAGLLPHGVGIDRNIGAVLGRADAQRFGEWDAPNPRPEANTSMLWQKKLRDYQRPARSKPIGALVPTSSNREEYVSQAREAKPFKSGALEVSNGTFPVPSCPSKRWQLEQCAANNKGPRVLGSLCRR